MPTSSPLLKVSRIETLYFDRIYALFGVSLEIEEGEIFTVLGPNGAGKTTLLRTIAGLLKDQPKKGEILFGGRQIDRKKDIIITAGGKNITPVYIENKLKFSPYVQDAVVIGERRKYLVALVLIDEDNVTKFAQDHRIPFTTFQDLTQNPEIGRLIETEIERVNKTLSQVEAIKKFALLPRRFYAEEGDVTPTMKVKRRALEERYADLIRGLYRD